MEIKPKFECLQPAVRRLLHTDWFERIAADEGIHFEHSHPGEPLILRTSDGLEVAVEEISDAPFVRFRSCDPRREDLVGSLARKAIDRIAAGDHGEIVWHHIPLFETDFRFQWRNPFGVLFQRLATQRVVSGWYRLGEEVLLEFSQDHSPDSQPQSIFTPKTTVNAYIRVAAPRAGRFSEFCASSLVERIGAICTFAVGRSLVGPPVALHANPDLFVELEQRIADRHVPPLSRKNISLDVLSPRHLPGGEEYHGKLCTALITFEAAFQVAHDAVACALYVVVAEGLGTPNASWKYQKVTDRFVRFYEETIPDHLDAMIDHPDFEKVFGIKRGRRANRSVRRALLNAMYEYRSVRVHQGLPASLRDIVNDTRKREDQQRAFFCTFAEEAILSYLAAPRSSLIGAPDTQPIRQLTGPSSS